MFPWLWFWCPQYQFPWGGDVVQDIEPTTTWFFGRIKPEAGNAKIEEKAFAVATYGKQIGLLTDVLIELADKNLGDVAVSAAALDELKRIRNAIDKLKEHEYDDELRTLEQRVMAVQRRGGRRFELLKQSFAAAAPKGEA